MEVLLYQFFHEVVLASLLTQSDSSLEVMSRASRGLVAQRHSGATLFSRAEDASKRL